jgi:hypothetical protein
MAQITSTVDGRQASGVSSVGHLTAERGERGRTRVTADTAALIV